MAPKRRRIIGRSSSQARRVRERREAETEEQRHARLSAQAFRQARARQLETQQQRQDRLTDDADRHSTSRQQETQQQRQNRLTDDAARHSTSRQQETQQQRQDRLTDDAARHSMSRQQETQEQHHTRLQAMQTNARRRRIAPLIAANLLNAAFNYSANVDFSSINAVAIGSMSQVCQHCLAKKWKGETPSMCCSNGKVRIPLLTEPPQSLQMLLLDTTPESKHFLKRIRTYNSAFQMTSFGANIITERGLMPTFKVHGQVYHRIGPLQPSVNEHPQFLQLYFVGNMQKQAEYRCNYMNGTRLDIIIQLQEMIHSTNSYVTSFKYALESSPPVDFQLVIDADKRPQGQHRRRFNEPTCNEVALIMSGQEHGKRDIVLKLRDNSIKRISETHRSYDPLQYPLICVHGEDGYHFGIPHTQGTKTVSCMEFYAYTFMIRNDYFNHLHRCQELFSQYAVDMYAKVETERLLYIRTHQKELRVDSYIHLRDAINNDVSGGTEVGQLCILPSSFTGSPRYMHERTQDAMTYVRTYGTPDLFITFTCNPTWKELNEELFPGQTPKARHDLLARVFRQKLIKMMHLIKKYEIFGPTRCDMYTIEWQKRGLPHAHILIWLKIKIHSYQIDSIISAELPNPANDQSLFDTIKKTMIHGPCGPLNPTAPCMEKGKCTKRYPRLLIKETQTGQDGYPLYRRRAPKDGGFTARMKLRNGQDVDIDNRWIVPYCPLLSKAFDAHINVEFCNSFKSIKYVCKYVNKGSDAAMYALQNQNTNDEVTQFQLGRYVSSNEAFWRILGFPIHERHPPIQQLSVHLINGQRVYFTEENALEKSLVPKSTTLTAFFNLCREDYFARTLLYCEVTSFYYWKNSKWSRRKRGSPVDGHPGIFKVETLARVYTIHPSQQECFYLRILLHEVKGPTSFEDLRRVEGDLCSTYREACFKRGLLEDDAQWEATMREAAVSQSPANLRRLFAVLLHVCTVSNPLALWQNHREDLSEDFKHQAQVRNPNTDYVHCDGIFNLSLIAIEDKVLSLGGNKLTSFGLPETIRSQGDNLSHEILRETSYNTDVLNQEVAMNEPKLLPDQRIAYSTILNSVKYQKGGVFFLDAPGGTGKTFITNLLLAKLRQNQQIALAVASSGIAATLLPGGRTAHAAFKLPLNLTNKENNTCNISKGTGKAEVLKRCRMIVWDECTMSHKAALEALDTTLQDIRENKTIMGRVTLVLAGDFRQTLPIIPRGTRADELKACLKSSYLWRHVKIFRLSTNMRAHLYGDQLSEQFANNLLQLGDGKLKPDPQGTIDMGIISTKVSSLDELKLKVFPNLPENYRNHKWLCERAILAPKNNYVNAINLQLLQQIPGNSHCYKSIDTVTDETQVVNYPTEFLNSLEPPGVPPHCLNLKVGAPIILLRNLDPPHLCNGTRLVVKKLMLHVIEATILSGCGKGEIVFIPRIPIIPTDLPFEFKRLQFPLRLSFAMSINKSQGQTLKVAGLHLEEPCFSHGQLYVGCSRVGTQNNLYVNAPDGKTENIVYHEALC